MVEEVIDMDFTLIGGELGKVTVENIQVRGTIVIELVKLSQKPPWFSGLRVYFPDPPVVDLSIHSTVVGLLSVKMDRFKETMIQVLRDRIIARSAVLPNRFCMGVGDCMDELLLRHWHPEGVLRVCILKAQGLSNPCDVKWYMPLRSSWAANKAAPCVGTRVGFSQKSNEVWLQVESRLGRN